MYSKLHDTHLHIDLYDDLPQIISEIEESGINVIAVTNLPVLFEKLQKKLNSKYIKIALGFHPELVFEYKKYIPEMWRHLDSTQFIGEVGLDFSKRPTDDCDTQINFFKELVRKCNSCGDKILSVHSRKGEDKVLEMIGDKFRGKIILHWYSGTMKTFERAIQYGYYFSINSAMLNSDKGKTTIRNIPIDRVLLESDGPFIKMNGKEVRPSNLIEITKSLSDLLQMNENEVIEILYENFNRLVQ